MKLTRHALFLLALACSGFLTLTREATRATGQEIYRWTDEQGQLHFGNQPPSNAKGLERKDRAKGQTEIECEAEVKAACLKLDKQYGRYARSDAYQNCVDGGVERCQAFKPSAKPTEARQRYLSTATLKFDPADGDSLTCEMRCDTRCRGSVEIRSDQTLKKGENDGATKYSLDVQPAHAGSAFCSVSTTSIDTLLSLSVVRGGSVIARTESQ